MGKWFWDFSFWTRGYRTAQTAHCAMYWIKLTFYWNISTSCLFGCFTECRECQMIKQQTNPAVGKNLQKTETFSSQKLSEEKFWADQNIQKTKILSRRKLSADRNWADHQLIEQQTDSAVSNLRGPASVTGLYCQKVARFPKASESEKMTSKKVAICSPGSIFKACHVMYYCGRSFTILVSTELVSQASCICNACDVQGRSSKKKDKG